jgi:hypothetical protein
MKYRFIAAMWDVSYGPHRSKRPAHSTVLGPEDRDVRNDRDDRDDRDASRALFTACRFPLRVLPATSFYKSQASKFFAANSPCFGWAPAYLALVGRSTI